MQGQSGTAGPEAVLVGRLPGPVGCVAWTTSVSYMHTQMRCMCFCATLPATVHELIVGKQTFVSKHCTAHALVLVVS